VLGVWPAAHMQAAHPFDGVSRCRPVIRRDRLLEQQRARVTELRGAKYEKILQDNPAIRLIKGWARFEDAGTLRIERPDGSRQSLVVDRILVATGARPVIPAIPGLADTPYWTSTEALETRTLPRHLLVLGGAVVALELAQAFRRLGSEVTLLARSTLLSKEDPAFDKGLGAALEAEEIRIKRHCVPERVTHAAGRFRVEAAGEVMEGDALLVATGRRPNTQRLALERAGLATGRHGHILVDNRMRTSVDNIYAAGDCTDQPPYVYVAAAAGTRAAVNMTGGDVTLDLSTLPAVVFTDPQVAMVGLSERAAKAQRRAVVTRCLPLENVPRALASFDTRGFIKLVAEADSGRLLGAQILAPEGGEVIQSAALAIRNRMTVDDLAGQLFPYLTMVEGLKLCAQTFTRDVTQLSCCAG